MPTLKVAKESNAPMQCLLSGTIFQNFYDSFILASILSAKRLGMFLNLTALLEVSEDQAEPSSLKA